MTKEESKYRDSQKKYLDSGRTYADLLLRVSKSDRSLLSIAKEIKSIGDNVHVFDSPVMTRAYNEIIAKSRISPEYHELVSLLERAKADLEQANYRLVKDRLHYFLAKSGVPVSNHDYSPEKLFTIINNPNASLIEKISVSARYIEDEIPRLVDFIDGKEITIMEGKIQAKTRDARNFLRNLEATLVARVNETFFESKKTDIVDIYIGKARDERGGIISDIASIGDSEHIRELERRLSSGDIYIENDVILPLTEKGKRYVRLLSEELETIMERKMDSRLLDTNNKSKRSSKVLSDIVLKVNEHEKKASKHFKLSKTAPYAETYNNLVDKYTSNVDGLKGDSDNVLQQIDAISKSALSVRKKLLQLTAKNTFSVEEAIPLATALSYLGRYSEQLNKDVYNLAQKLEVTTSPIAEVPVTGDYLVEDQDFDSEIRSLVSGKISKRNSFQENLDQLVSEYTANTSEFKEFKQVCARQNDLKKKLEVLARKYSSLYDNFSVFEDLIVKIVELEIKKKELTADLLHQIDLSHKKIWLNKIQNENNEYISNSFAQVNEGSKTFAKEVNAELTGRVEVEIQKIIDGYQAIHKSHSDTFVDVLKNASAKVKNGIDVSVVSADLLTAWSEYKRDHEKQIENIDTEMVKLEKYLSTFGDKSRKEIEKNLILDIRKRAKI